MLTGPGVLQWFFFILKPSVFIPRGRGILEPSNLRVWYFCLAMGYRPKWLSEQGWQLTVTHLGPIEVQSGTAPRLPDAAETGTRLLWIMAWGMLGDTPAMAWFILIRWFLLQWFKHVQTNEYKWYSVYASYICAWFSVKYFWSFLWCLRSPWVSMKCPIN